MLEAKIGGFVAPGYEAVAEAFQRNFDEGKEVGAAFAASRNGETVVDLWGGYLDASKTRPWNADTLQIIFSGTKGLTAICLMMLMDRGKLDLEQPVSHYWPEFGKPEIKVRNVVSHTARIPGTSMPITVEDLTRPHYLTQLMERQQPFDDPRAAYTYHGMSYGWLCDELMRRIDGRSIGQFFADEIAGPLGLELWIGLPEALESRVATVEMTDNWANNPLFAPPSATLAQDDPLRFAVWYNPRTLGRDVFIWNRRDIHAAAMPASSGIGTARSVAKLYSIVASGGGQLMSPATAALAPKELVYAWDGVLNEMRRNGIGFQLQADGFRHFGPPDNGFGHDGAGGSTHGGWPDTGVGFSYSMNLLWDGKDGPARYEVLLDALAKSVAG